MDSYLFSNVTLRAPNYASRRNNTSAPTLPSCDAPLKTLLPTLENMRATIASECARIATEIKAKEESLQTMKAYTMRTTEEGWLRWRGSRGAYRVSHTIPRALPKFEEEKGIEEDRANGDDVEEIRISESQYDTAGIPVRISLPSSNLTSNSQSLDRNTGVQDVESGSGVRVGAASKEHMPASCKVGRRNDTMNGSSSMSRATLSNAGNRGESNNLVTGCHTLEGNAGKADRKKLSVFNIIERERPNSAHRDKRAHFEHEE